MPPAALRIENRIKRAIIEFKIEEKILAETYISTACAPSS